MRSPIDVWSAKTNVSGVPYCVTKADCVTKFHAHFLSHNNYKLDATGYLGRMTCVYKVKVPDYYISDHNVSDVSEEGVYFSRGVCACDTTWDLYGPECSPGKTGLALRYLFLALAIWLTLLFVRVVVLLGSGHLKSKRKRWLAFIALVIYVGEFTWVISTRAAMTVILSQALRYSLQGFSLTVAALAVFMFVCGMMLDTTVLIRKSSVRANKIEEMKLRRLERIFKVIPIGVSLLSAVVWLGNFGAASFVFLMFTQTVTILFVAATFTASIRVIDKRLSRLTPSGTSNTPGTGGVGSVQPSEYSQCLVFSKKLRSMALRMQRTCVFAVICGAVYAYFNMTRSAQQGVRVNVAFGIWLLSISCVPFVGLLELVEVNLKVKPMMFTTQMRGGAKDMGGVTDSNVESSDYGTLGG
jgi:hypothetical protein